MLVCLAYFIKEIKLLITILFCLLFAQNIGKYIQGFYLCARQLSLFFHKDFKIVFFIGMELKGNTTLVLEELMKNCSRIL